MKKYLGILGKCPLFAGIGEDDLCRMLTCLGAKIAAFDKKYTVFPEGSPAKYIGIVLSGSVQMVRVDYFGNRSILGTAGPGEIFSEAFACAETPSLPVSFIADEPCEIMFIDSGHIIRTCQNGCGFHQQLIFNLMKDLAQKNLSFHRRIEVTSKRTTREKLLTYLAAEAQKANSHSFHIPFDRQELADFLEVDRSGLSAEIGKLKKEGILENQKNHFVLL